MIATRMLANVQAQTDERGIALDRVGVTGLCYPLIIREQTGGQQTVTAHVDLTVGLHDRQRGAHLSSLVEVLHRYRTRLFSMDDLVGLVQQVRTEQDGRGLPDERADIQMRFHYFLPKTAPASGAPSLLAYRCGFDVTLDGAGSKSIVVGVPVTTVCPCSLAISDIGAHNQRAEVTVQLWQSLRDDRLIWFEDVIALVERCASSEIYTVLKRADEKAVTERMFGAPRFVEDVVRDVILGVRQDVGRVRYRVRCENVESIHAHSAYAEASGAC